MPKRVDHEVRRREIIDSTWRIIADRGFHATTTRDISAEMGVALGAINHYFPTKDDLLLASYEHVFIRTSSRYAARVGERTGMDALRILAEEMMPIGSEQLLEARVVLPFWERCASSERFAAVNQAGLTASLELLGRHLDEAAAAGDLAPAVDRALFAEELLSTIAGMQALAVLLPERYSRERLLAMLDGALRSISRK